MKFTDKITAIQLRPNSVLFFKQGCFYILYNENLWWFCNEIKPVKTLFKSLKKDNIDMVYGGFPVSSLPNLKKQYPAFFDVVVDDDYGFSIKANYHMEHYNDWFTKIKQDHLFLVSLETEENPVDIISKIKEFALEKKTPLEAFLFVKDLQNNYCN